MPAVKKKRSGYIGDNARWNEFVEKLKERGVTHRWIWEARSNPERDYPNVHCVGFTGSGFTPAVLVAIVVDYNNHPGDQMGFGLHIDHAGRTMDQEADRIAGKR